MTTDSYWRHYSMFVVSLPPDA